MTEQQKAVIDQLYKQGMRICDMQRKTGYEYYAIKDYLRRYKARPIAEKQEQTVDALIQGQKEKLIADGQKRTIADLTKKAAINELILDKVASAIESIPRVDFQPRYVEYKGKDKRSAEEIILDISDIQAGTLIDGEGTGGINAFAWAVMEREFETLYRGVTSISKRQMELAPIRKLHIFMLGDMVEGWDIYGGQTQNIDQTVFDQVFKLAYTMAEFILQLHVMFPEIEISCVVGNHGRVGKKGENPAWVNWDGVFYRVLELQLQNYPDITFDIPKAWWMIKNVNGWDFLLQHGDNVKGWAGVPFYGIERFQQKSREKLETIDARFDYIEMGHLHTPTMLPLMGGGFTTINGCWPGASVLALKDMNTTGKPIQWIKGIHPEYGMTWCYPIYLNGRK